MKAIPQRTRALARAASSRHSVDALVATGPVPIGIPALFLADRLSRDRSAVVMHGAMTNLLAEYAGVEGYAYAWGQLIEQRLGRFVLWRVVPVTLWERLSERRMGSPLHIEDVLDLVQPDIRPALASHLPAGLLLTGCQGHSRRCRHALFTLVLADQRAASTVRHWLATVLLDRLLPPLLNRIERRAADLLRVAAR